MSSFKFADRKGSDFSVKISEVFESPPITQEMKKEFAAKCTANFGDDYFDTSKLHYLKLKTLFSILESLNYSAIDFQTTALRFFQSVKYPTWKVSDFTTIPLPQLHTYTAALRIDETLHVMQRVRLRNGLDGWIRQEDFNAAIMTAIDFESPKPKEEPKRIEPLKNDLFRENLELKLKIEEKDKEILKLRRIIDKNDRRNLESYFKTPNFTPETREVESLV